MSNNVRFSTSLHILTLLAHGKGELVSSEYLAGSINVNAAIIRKELSNLRKHGLVESKEGKGGGNKLAKAAGSILLSDIYQAVRESPLLGRKNSPNPDCLIGRQINGHLETLFIASEQSLLDNLSRQTLAGFTRKFKG